VLLDRERCVLCARCTRFSEQIAGDPFIALVERGALQQVGIYQEQPFDSYFSGNTVQICPVGALTGAAYRFRPARSTSSPPRASASTAQSGCALRTDHRRGPGAAPAGRRRPRGQRGVELRQGPLGLHLRAAPTGSPSRSCATPTASCVRPPGPRRSTPRPAGCSRHASAGGVGVLTGGRLTVEDAYAYSKFARSGARHQRHRLPGPAALGRGGRSSSPPRRRARTSSRTDLERAGNEEETYADLARPYGTSPSCSWVSSPRRSRRSSSCGCARRRTGARLAWIPRRAGEVGAVTAGCLPSLLPGGRLVSDGAARVDTGSAWGVDSLPSEPGLDVNGMLVAASDETLKALVVAGAEIGDFADPVSARDAFEHVGFLVSIENRLSDISACADVVFPAALLEEQSGTFYNWEHRPRPVARVNKTLRSPMTDIRVLAALADAMGSDLGVRSIAQAAAELAELSEWDGARAGAPAFPAADDAITPDGFRLATWRELIDDSRRNDGADELLATAKPPVARLSASTAAQAGVSAGGTVAVGTARGELTYDVVIDDSVVDGVVWIPSRAAGRNVAETLGAGAGDPVTAKEGGRS
jgi:NADH-quinone oxidoreductase subunit G